MFKFIYCRYKIHPNIEKFCENWFLLLDSEDSLNSFLDLRSDTLAKRYFNLKQNGSKIDDYRYKNGDHIYNNDESTIATLLYLDDTRKSVADDFKCLEKLLSGYMYVYLKYGHVIINQANGCRAFDDSFEILKEKLSKDFIFPTSSEKDISITKWPNGSHYYAKVGNCDVVDNLGNVKWDSREKANMEAKKFLEKLKYEENNE